MLTNNLITRFPNGLNSAPNGPNDIFNSIQFPDWTPWAHRYEEDFYTYTVAQWTVTNVAGTGAVARADGNGGLLRITTDANNNDGTQIQKVASGLSGLSWLFDPTKPFWMDIRAAVSALTVNAYLGLAPTDTSIIAAVDDGFSFRLATGGALTMVAEKNGNESSLALGTIAAATQFRMSMFWDGGGTTYGRLYGALDGTVIGYLEPGANFDDDAALLPSFALQTLSANARTMDIDRITIVQGL